MQKQPRVNIALRGAGGLLGHRLLRTIMSTQPDLRVNAVILDTHEQSFRRFESLFQTREFPNDLKIYIDATRAKLADFQDKMKPKCELIPLDQANGDLSKCDAILDATIIRGKDNLEDFYNHYSKRKPVIFQSGTYPNNTLVSPPFESGESELKRYRVGNCLLSGISPVLKLLQNRTRSMALTFVVQRQTTLNEYTTNDNLSDIISNPETDDFLEKNMRELMPELDEFHAETFEIPGHDYYRCNIRIKLAQKTTREEILDELEDCPRVHLAPTSLPISTGQVKQLLKEQIEENGGKLEPIICFSCPGGVEVKGEFLNIKVAIFSKAIAVLPNIDAVRGFCTGMPMLESMRITDEQFGYKKNGCYNLTA